MKRCVYLALTVMAAALLLAGGVALAKTIDCSGGPCVGTKKADIIRGTNGADQIDGKGGNDGIKGNAGNDTINGGKGNDAIDDLVGGDKDSVQGGAGNDRIDVQDDPQDDGNDPNDVDTVDCGPGDDVVFGDPLDKQHFKNCEKINT